jgi:hypothetical protein
MGRRFSEFASPIRSQCDRFPLAGDLLSLFFREGVGFAGESEHRIGEGLVMPGQLGRNLSKVSPPHPLFQRANSIG